MSEAVSSHGVKRVASEPKTIVNINVAPISENTSANTKKLNKERQALAAKTDKLIARRDAIDHQIAETVKSMNGSTGGTTHAQLTQSSADLQEKERRHMQNLISHAAVAEKFWHAEPTGMLRQNWDSLRELQGRFRSHLGPRDLPTLEDLTTPSSDTSSDDNESNKQDIGSSKANSSIKRSVKEHSKRKYADDVDQPSKKLKAGVKVLSETPVPVPVPQARHEPLAKPSVEQDMDEVISLEKNKQDKKKRKKKKAQPSESAEAEITGKQQDSQAKDTETASEKKARKKRERKERKRANGTTTEQKETESRHKSSGTKADHSKDKNAHQVRQVTAVPLPVHYPRPDNATQNSTSPVPVPGHYPQIAGTLTPIRPRHGSKIVPPSDPASVKPRDTGPRGPHLRMFHSADFATDGSNPYLKATTPDLVASPKTWRMESSGRRSQGKSDITMRIGRISPSDDNAHIPDPADESPAEMVRKNKSGRPKGSKTKNRKADNFATSANATPHSVTAVGTMAAPLSSSCRSDNLVRVLTPSTRVAAAFLGSASARSQEVREARFKAQLERDAEVYAQERVEWRRAMNLK
ncbi:hypothetical protein ACHAQH_000241 [Verticillium albo-atrum]